MSFLSISSEPFNLAWSPFVHRSDARWHFMIKDFDNSVALPRTNGSFFIGAVTRSTRCRLLRLIQQQNDLDSECFLREPIEQITLKGAALLLGSITKELSQKSTSNGLFKEMLTKVSTIACLQTQWCWLVLGDTLPETDTGAIQNQWGQIWLSSLLTTKLHQNPNPCQ